MPNKFLQPIKIITLAIILIAGLSYAAPTGVAPTTGSKAPPLNMSTMPQLTQGTLVLGANYNSAASVLRVLGKTVAKNVLVYTNAVGFNPLTVGSFSAGYTPTVPFEANTYLLSTALSAANNPGVTYPARLCAEVVSGVGTGNIIICPGNLGVLSTTSVTLVASPTSITTVDSTTLTWTTTGSPSSCTASGDWSGTKTTSGVSDGESQTLSGLSVGTKTFTITCSKVGAPDVVATATVTVSAVSPITVSISASPTTINQGSQTTLTWITTGSPTACTASGNWSGSKTSSGDIQTLTPPVTGTNNFTITCSKAGTANVTATTSVNVNAVALGVVLTATPNTITSSADSVDLTWTITGSPTGCTASGYTFGAWTSSPRNQAGGTITLTGLSGTHTFTISCWKGNTTVTGNATVTDLTPLSVTLTASPSSISIPAGNSTTLTWTTTGSPTSCSVSSNPAALNLSGMTSGAGGSVTKSWGSFGGAGTYNLTLTCSRPIPGGGGTESEIATTTIIVTN